MTFSRILLVGGPASALCLAGGLARELGAEIRLAEDGDQALAAIRETGCDLVLAEVTHDVGALIRRLRARGHTMPVLGCGVGADAELAVAAIRAGARDYVPLPPTRALIAAVLQDIVERPAAMSGRDPRFLQTVHLAARLTPATSNLLVVGEAGTGKQLLAWHVHRQHGAGPFVTFDCRMQGPDRRAALVGAIDAATGDEALTQASGGTLLLRHIDHLPWPLQLQLAAGAPSAARLIATTTEPVKALLAGQAIVPKLLEALGPSRLWLPPLRERGADIAQLAAEFAARAGERLGSSVRHLSEDCGPVLRRYAWPGNVRELEDVITRATLLAFGERIMPADLLTGDGQPLASRASASVDALVGHKMDTVERALILETLQRCNGNRTAASLLLGISVRTMRNKLRAFLDEGVAVPPAAA